MPIPEFIVETRKKIGTDLMWVPSVCAVVLRDSTVDSPWAVPDVLLVRRADNGQWTPVTGIVDPGEEPHVAAVREVLEETGRLAEAQAIVMGVMEESYAGAAEAARNTLGGSLTVLKNTFNDLIEGDAGSLNGATDAVNMLTDALADPRTGEAIDSLVSGLLAVGSAVGPVLREGLAGARIGVLALTDVIQGLVTQAIAVVDAFYRIATFDWSGVKNAVSQLQYGQAQIMAGLTADYSKPRVDPMFAAVTGGVRTHPARPRTTASAATAKTRPLIRISKPDRNLVRSAALWREDRPHTRFRS